MPVIVMKESGTLHKGGSSGHNDMRNGVCSEGRADGLTVGCERKEGMKNESKVLARAYM